MKNQKQHLNVENFKNYLIENNFILDNYVYYDYQSNSLIDIENINFEYNSIKKNEVETDTFEDFLNEINFEVFGIEYCADDFIITFYNEEDVKNLNLEYWDEEEQEGFFYFEEKFNIFFFKN